MQLQAVHYYPPVVTVLDVVAEVVVLDVVAEAVVAVLDAPAKVVVDVVADDDEVLLHCRMR